jgi:hypothetical protein
MLPACDTALRHRVLRIETAAAGSTELPLPLQRTKPEHTIPLRVATADAPRLQLTRCQLPSGRRQAVP